VSDCCYIVFVLSAAIPSLVTLILENTAVTSVGVRQYAACAPPLLENFDLSRTTVTQDIFISLEGLWVYNVVFTSTDS